VGQFKCCESVASVVSRLSAKGCLVHIHSECLCHRYCQFFSALNENKPGWSVLVQVHPPIRHLWFITFFQEILSAVKSRSPRRSTSWMYEGPSRRYLRYGECTAENLDIAVPFSVVELPHVIAKRQFASLFALLPEIGFASQHRTFSVLTSSMRSSTVAFKRSSCTRRSNRPSAPSKIDRTPSGIVVRTHSSSSFFLQVSCVLSETLFSRASKLVVIAMFVFKSGFAALHQSLQLSIFNDS